MDRRELFRILGAGLAIEPLLAQHQHGSTVKIKLSNYKPRALNPQEYQTLDRLLDILLPTDESGPGAHEAHVAAYIDTVLHYAEPPFVERWRTGLAAVEAHASERHGKPFLELNGGAQTEVMADMARNETNAETPLEQFFVTMKQTGIAAYYLSSAGRKSLGYTGDTAIESFPGCTHPEHQA